MKQSKYIFLFLVLLLTACKGGNGSGGDVTKPQYTITLTGIATSKKGSGEALAVSGLPAQGATLTQE